MQARSTWSSNARLTVWPDVDWPAAAVTSILPVQSHLNVDQLQSF